MWTQHLISTSRGTFEFFKLGTGSPLCITHQYIEFNEKEYTFAQPFAENYSVYLINLKGCGNSDKAVEEKEYSMENSVKDLEAIKEALGFAKWGFAGHSTGGMLAMLYALNFPNSLNKLIIGGSCASSKYINHPDSIYCKDNSNNARLLEIIDLLNDSSITLEERRKLNKEWNLMSFYKKNEFDQLMKNVYLGKSMIKRLNYFTSTDIRNFDLRKELYKISIPTYIYIGKYDNQCPLFFSEEIAKSIPKSTFSIFEQSSHNPFIEEKEKFNVFVISTVN
ncbi:alpha/beta fold hydrolase [Rummeliibacillus sp. SL167]|uniref:alpha/beta fold hydrolase n=1 Tax=Rummeliibacillus sp. SL167 TaxID=2579792 RepID=UPI0011B7D428|nr:alpha/beta fold hydrolase [Rummeliibacillus sp. SL167]